MVSANAEHQRLAMKRNSASSAAADDHAVTSCEPPGLALLAYYLIGQRTRQLQQVITMLLLT